MWYIFYFLFGWKNYLKVLIYMGTFFLVPISFFLFYFTPIVVNSLSSLKSGHRKFFTPKLLKELHILIVLHTTLNKSRAEFRKVWLLNYL